MPFALLLLAQVAAAAPAPTPATDEVRCSLDYARETACRLTDVALGDAQHRMIFDLDGRRVTFVGRRQTGWWSGRLNGRPAMGYERNRGNVVLSTVDLRTSFAYWYPHAAHGSY